MQSLDPTVEALGKARHRLDGRDRDAGGTDRRRRAARGHDLDARLVQRPGQPVQPGLVVDADDRAPDGNSGQRSAPDDPSRGDVDRRPGVLRRGVSWRGVLWRGAKLDRPAGDRPASSQHRGDRVREQRPFCRLDPLRQRLLVVAVEHRHGLLRHHRPAVQAGVHQEDGAAGDLHAVGERVPDPVHAGEGRQQGRVGVDAPAGELLEERRPEQLHESGGDDQVGPQASAGLGERLVPARALGVVANPAHERRDPGSLGAAERPRAVPVSADRDDVRPERAGLAGIDEMLQQSSLARCQHNQA